MNIFVEFSVKWVCFLKNFLKSIPKVNWGRDIRSLHLNFSVPQFPYWGKQFSPQMYCKYWTSYYTWYIKWAKSLKYIEQCLVHNEYFCCCSFIICFYLSSLFFFHCIIPRNFSSHLGHLRNSLPNLPLNYYYMSWPQFSKNKWTKANKKIIYSHHFSQISNIFWHKDAIKTLHPCCISWKSHRPNCQDSYTVFLQSQSTLTKEYLEFFFFNQWTETCPTQLTLHSYSLLCTFTNQSERLHNDQSGGKIPTNQDSVTWTNQTVRIWAPHLNKNGSIRAQGRYFLYISRLPIYLGGAHYEFWPEAVFPWFMNCSPE